MTPLRRLSDLDESAPHSSPSALRSDLNSSGPRLVRTSSTIATIKPLCRAGSACWSSSPRALRLVAPHCRESLLSGYPLPPRHSCSSDANCAQGSPLTTAHRGNRPRTKETCRRRAAAELRLPSPRDLTRVHRRRSRLQQTNSARTAKANCLTTQPRSKTPSRRSNRCPTSA